MRRSSVINIGWVGQKMDEIDKIVSTVGAKVCVLLRSTCKWAHGLNMGDVGVINGCHGVCVATTGSDESLEPPSSP